MPESMLTEPAIEVSGLRISCAIAAASRAHSRQPVLNPQIPLQAPDFGQIVEGVDVANVIPAGDRERGRRHPKGLAETIRRHKAHFPVGAVRIDGGQRVEKELADRLTQKFVLRTFKQLLRRGIRQRDVTVEPGGDQPAADGLNDIFVQRLQIFQRPAACASALRPPAATSPPAIPPGRRPPGSRTD